MRRNTMAELTAAEEQAKQEQTLDLMRLHFELNLRAIQERMLDLERELERLREEKKRLQEKLAELQGGK
jgi:chromosome segregation ATPase